MKEETVYEGPPETRQYSPSASIVQVDAGKLMSVLPWFVMALAVSIVALVSVVVVYISMGERQEVAYKALWDKFQMVENSNAMLEMYVMETDARLVNRGFIKPEEDWVTYRSKLFVKPKERSK